jgi:hypothetical protein
MELNSEWRQKLCMPSLLARRAKNGDAKVEIELHAFLRNEIILKFMAWPSLNVIISMDYGYISQWWSSHKLVLSTYLAM